MKQRTKPWDDKRLLVRYSTLMSKLSAFHADLIVGALIDLNAAYSEHRNKMVHELLKGEPKSLAPLAIGIDYKLQRISNAISLSFVPERVSIFHPKHFDSDEDYREAIRNVIVPACNQENSPPKITDPIASETKTFLEVLKTEYLEAEELNLQTQYSSLDSATPAILKLDSVVAGLSDYMKNYLLLADHPVPSIGMLQRAMDAREDYMKRYELPEKPLRISLDLGKDSSIVSEQKAVGAAGLLKDMKETEASFARTAK